MSWRKHKTHAEETKAVQQALGKAGIPAKVGHGRGTGWGWLEINLGPQARGKRDLQDKALHIAKDTTGRSGEYDGEILILTQ